MQTKEKINMRTQSKFIGLIFLFILFQLSMFSQRSEFKKIYKDEIYKKELIIIENDSFKIISNNIRKFITPKNATVAFGTVKFYDSNFIELNSVNYNEILSRSVTVSESQDSTIKNDIQIRFSFPFSGQYRIYLYTNKYDYIYENQSEITIPIKYIMGSKKIEFEIFKINNFSTDLTSDNCNKINSYYYCYYIKNDSTNCISISIPNLTDIFFQYNVIIGEYARISDEKLYWRGIVYDREAVNEASKVWDR